METTHAIDSIPQDVSLFAYSAEGRERVRERGLVIYVLAKASRKGLLPFEIAALYPRKRTQTSNTNSKSAKATASSHDSSTKVSAKGSCYFSSAGKRI